jgi:hypothetical protein
MLSPEFDTNTLPGDQSRLTDESGVYLLEDFTAGVIADDNCTQEVILAQLPLLNEPLTPGVYDITITATDAFSNETDYTFELTVELLLGANDFNIEGKVVVYPNPVSELFQIETSGGILLEKVTIYSIHGKKLMVTSEEKINLTSFSEGFYLVKITTDHGILTKKVIKE